MSTRARCVAWLVLASALLAGCGGKPPRSFHESAGGFSFDPPAGWTASEVPGLKYRVVVGPAKDGFSPNINVVDEGFGGPLAEYIDKNVSALQAAFKDPRIVRREDFRTADDQAAGRVVVEDEQQGRSLRQTFYFFGGKSRKYVATCTALADGADAWDPAFESSMKTFRID
jgi:hypothetical protein